ncbi:MAG: sigma-54 dependent transcriptional regulator, partial [Proteobacteria bacterium]|nr:sigma-54 dependent transcriptional regulator [Pseudomonadota bacterium]
VLEAARARDERSAVILMTAYGTIESAVEAMRRGAFDFLQKPFDLEQLEVRVAKALEHGRLLREVTHLRAERVARYAPANIVGTSPALQNALGLVRKVASSRATALVTGETGTGKELVAGMIHGLSARADGPFIKVYCAALPETLLESELFGHERGAFTGADRIRIGRFEQAHGGTLFLDEVGDMAPSTQAKLLRVLQDREFTRLGGSRPLRVDVRIVAATNRDLEREMHAGRFREDLFYRLNVLRVEVPPLRERREDIPLLVDHFLALFRDALAKPVRGIHDDALQRLCAYRWPGNVRELENVIERAMILARGDQLSLRELPANVVHLEPGEADVAPGDLSLRKARRAAESEMIRRALRETGGNRTHAAKLLGISHRALLYKVKEYELRE